MHYLLHCCKYFVKPEIICFFLYSYNIEKVCIFLTIITKNIILYYMSSSLESFKTANNISDSNSKLFETAKSKHFDSKSKTSSKTKSNKNSKTKSKPKYNSTEELISRMKELFF